MPTAMYVATVSAEKAHGRYKHWLWPMYYKENTQAGCNQCHNRDRVTPGANVLNEGKNLFSIKGCVGCHRYEGYDREADALANSRQQIRQLEMERKEYQLAVDDLKQDRGGIADIELAMKDGYTTKGGLGLGLSGSKRLVNEFEIDSSPGTPASASVCVTLLPFAT